MKIVKKPYWNSFSRLFQVQKISEQQRNLCKKLFGNLTFFAVNAISGFVNGRTKM